MLEITGKFKQFSTKKASLCKTFFIELFLLRTNHYLITHLYYYVLKKINRKNKFMN